MGKRIKRLASFPGFWLRGLICGLAGGFILGLFLRLVEQNTGHQVYRLLLNVDFISFLPPHMPEWIEFALHMVVSLIIGLLYSSWVMSSIKPRPLLSGLILGLLSSLLYFPLADLSDRVPSPSDMTAFAWWLTGHLLFGFTLFGVDQMLNPLYRMAQSKRA
ncbi:hypothetical protein MUG84_15615 [Paenibacillus sp. KQZ6P-2]|uniref:Uncharacterized protein n=1 Tax=Paenibacillus mangrovi TaxID=2931978 RepID=A0A9X1WWA8_9BACL|nr:hypothetical protein [Paenibacillus mangrovi]MCJ8013159.1 hypothetical protein [Paenibacillus mangrovi]